MNLNILSISTAGAYISSNVLLIGASVSFLGIIFVLVRTILRATENDKKLDDQVIALAVENEVDKMLKATKDQIEALHTQSAKICNFEELDKLKEDADILQTRLTMLTDTSYCSLTPKQNILHEELTASLGEIFDFVFSKGNELRGLPYHRVQPTAVLEKTNFFTRISNIFSGKNKKIKHTLSA